MKKLYLLSIFVLTSIALIYSCSTEEEDTTPPPSVVATPEPEPPAPTQYTLTVSAGEGGTVSTEGGTYDEGTEVTITATPAEGYEFVGWEGSDSTEASLTVTLGANTTLNALFEAVVQYTLSVKVKDYASGVLIILSEEWYDFELNFNEGSEVNIVAIPEEGYEFVGWEGIENNSAEITLAVDSNTSIQAIFQRLPFTSKSERYSTINETTGYFKESYYFERYLTVEEALRFSRTWNKDNLKTYDFRNRRSISYDFNKDGFLDLYFFAEIVVGGNKINGKHCFVSDYYNKDWEGLSGIPQSDIIEIDASFVETHHSEINDIDNDGNLEILSWTWETHDKYNGYDYSTPDEKGIIISSFDENFELVSEKEVGIPKAFHYSASGDVDNDGDIDLLSFPTIAQANISTLQRNPTILFNNATGTYIEELIFKNESIVNDYFSFHGTTFKLFDLDNDGFLDLIFGYDLGTLNTPPPPVNGIEQFDFNDVYILWGEGTGKFSWDEKVVISIKNEINFQQSLLGIGFSDFDNDGDVDVFLSSTRTEETGNKDDFPATNYNSYIINLLENKSRRVFEDETVNKIEGYYHINIEHAGPLYDLSFLDKDSDGDYDMVPMDLPFMLDGTNDSFSRDLYWENTGGSFVRRIND